uniref:Membrane protein insertase YidC n=1 Tax=Glossina pallidipes TaxID=7398 RepID=A0A1A9Z0Y5_GLOPL
MKTTETICHGNSFAFNVNHKIKNYGNNPIEVTFFSQLKQSIENKKINDNYNFNFHTYRGAAYSSDDHKYKKYEFNDIKNNKHLNIITNSGWVAMLQQYFLVAWIPEKMHKYHFYTEKLYDNSQVSIGFKSYPISILQGEEKNIQSTLWVGPKLQNTMKIVADYLNLTIDYGWLWFIAQPLFTMLTWIYTYTNNWVRGLMYPLTKSQYTSMAKMRILQPKIINIKNKFSQDKHRQSQEMIALYKKQKLYTICFLDP